MSFRLAHLSDPHLPLPPGRPALWTLTVKQALALASWRRRRCRVTSPAVLEALRGELERFAPDHIAVTGDLVNLAWGPEFQAAQTWLTSLGGPDRVSAVPGNHDLTRAMPWPDGIGRWAGFRAGDGDGPPLAAFAFPFLRRRGEVALIGLSSALPTRPFSASGRLGAQQLDRAASLLQEAAGLFRVVLIHHPPVAGPGGRRKALQDRASLCRILARHGAELVLHGHHHTASLAALPGPSGPIPVIGAASASSGAAHAPAGWHLHTVAREGSAWCLTTTSRRYDPASGTFRAAGQWRLLIPEGGLQPAAASGGLPLIM